VRLALLRALIVVAAGLWVYAPVLHGDWLWDDNELVTENLQLRSLHGLAQIWFAAPLTDYWPLTWTVLWVEWHFWGLQTLGYHLVSLGLNLASGFLLWRILGRLGLRWGWLGALLFVVHPLAVDSVAWLSEIKNTLSLPLFLLALDAWLDADRGERGAWGRSVAWYLAAMLAKTSVVMLPAFLLLHQWWRHGKMTARDLRRMIPFAVIALVLGLVTIHFQAGRDSTRAAAAHGLVPTVACAGQIVFFYLRKFAWPFHLLPVYPNWPFDPPTVLQLLSVPLLFAMGAGLWTQRRGWGRPVLLGFGFFILNLLPVIGLIGMAFMSISRVADHLVYLPMLGLVGLTTLGIERVEARLAASWRPAWIAAVATVLLVLAVTAHRHAKIYLSRDALCAYTLARNPEATPVLNDYGVLLLRRGQVPEAIAQFDRTLQLIPDNAVVRSNLGFALLEQDRWAAAAVQLARAIRDDRQAPASWHAELAWALFHLNRWPEAMDECNRALAIDPTLPQPSFIRGIIDITDEDWPDAVTDLNRYCAHAQGDANVDYVRLWLWIAQRRLGQPAAQADRDLGAALAGKWQAAPEAWVTKLGDYLLGRISEPELLAAAASTDAARARGNRCEAGYYVGMKALVDGDQRAAIRELQSSVATGETEYFEYLFAQAELKRLAPVVP
jgi:lipoprotein NlpI